MLCHTSSETYIAEPSGELWTTCHVKPYTIKLIVEKVYAEIRNFDYACQ